MCITVRLNWSHYNWPQYHKKALNGFISLTLIMLEAVEWEIYKHLCMYFTKQAD